MQRFTCSHLLGSRFSAEGAAGTSTGGFSVSLADGLCAVTAPFCSWRNLFLSWRLDGCLLEYMELGDSIFWNASRSFAGWASVFIGCGTDPGLSLACSFPVSFSDCLPVCLMPLSFLFTVVHSSCQSRNADGSKSAVSKICDLDTGKLTPVPDLLRFQPLLFWWLTVVCHPRCNLVAYGSLHT